MKLSVGLITFNEEKNIARTLDAVKEIADEIIIVDSGSTDKTIEIAEKYGVNIYHEVWKGYGAQKNSVINKCKGSWILLIDADEEISYQLSREILNIIKNENGKKVFLIKRVSICFGKKIRYGGWANDYVHRLFLNGAGKFDDRLVHENFITAEKTYKIKKEINHYTYENLENYFNKFNRYTSESAIQYKKQSKKKPFILYYLNSWFKFFKMYILRAGFLDGYEGYLLARLASFYVFIKYAKLKEKNR